VWGTAIAQGAAKYPYDPRRADQLMQEAGYTRGAEGFYASPTDGRLTFEVKTNAASDNESEVQILASTWRQNGFDAREAVLPASQAQDPELRSTYTGMYTNSQNCCESAVLGLTSAAVSRAENRWAGGNRSGWSNPEFDRTADAFTRVLARSEREQQLTQLVRIVTEDVQSITLFIRAQVWVHVGGLKGMTVAPPEGNMSWNIQNWEFS
jgi:peptide/nickel transport system substrate-binding protein